jgi:hypothetical protein
MVDEDFFVGIGYDIADNFSIRDFCVLSPVEREKRGIIADMAERATSPEQRLESETFTEQQREIVQPGLIEHATTAKHDELPSVVAAPSIAAPSQEKSAMRIELEALLSDDTLRAQYAALSPSVQATFRRAATHVADKVERMMLEGLFEVENVHDLVEAWLRSIPNVNPSYLKQEAQLKVGDLQRFARNQSGTN